MSNNDFSGKEGGISSNATPTLSISSVNSNWNNTRSSREMAQLADRNVTREHYRALLTQTALTNVGALSTLEEHLCNVAPYGSERYRGIVNAYAMSAAMRIAKW